jgi:hypothetical protein
MGTLSGGFELLSRILCLLLQLRNSSRMCTVSAGRHICTQRGAEDAGRDLQSLHTLRHPTSSMCEVGARDGCVTCHCDRSVDKPIELQEEPLGKNQFDKTSCVLLTHTLTLSTSDKGDVGALRSFSAVVRSYQGCGTPSTTTSARYSGVCSKYKGNEQRTSCQHTYTLPVRIALCGSVNGYTTLLAQRSTSGIA